MRAATIAVLVLSAGLLPLAGALAQPQTGSASVSMTLPTLAKPVKPTGPQNTTATVRYQWQDGLATDNVTIELSYEGGPPWLNSSFTPSTVTFSRPQQSSSGVETRLVNVTLDVSETARAYTEGTATYAAQASASGTIPSAQGQAELPLTAGFAGRLVADLPQGGNVTAWGGILERVPIELENTANGPITVDVLVDRSPADARLIPPDDVRIGYQDGNESLTTHLEVRTPWSVSLEGPVEIQLSPEHATRGAELGEKRVGFQLEGQSAIPIPTPSPVYVLAAVGLALLLRRR